MDPEYPSETLGPRNRSRYRIGHVIVPDFACSSGFAQCRVDSCTPEVDSDTLGKQNSGSLVVELGSHNVA